MALKVIGAGWGRTGTESLKKALEIIGFGKCYHMFELLKDGKRVALWEQLQREGKTDYEALFEGFQSSVDFPACMYYRQFMEYYPDAKVILSYRDPERWYESASKTIFRPMPPFLVPLSRVVGLVNRNIGYFPRIMQYVIDMMFDGYMQGRVTDKAFVIDLYNKWVDEVKRTVPPDRLLVYEVKDGWEPLCKFLGVPVPDLPFPKSNDRDQFQERLKVKNFIKEFSSKGEHA